MPRGKKKSIEQHKADGTYRADRHDLPDISREVEHIKPYLKLKDEGREYFYSVCNDLREEKKLAPEDLTHIAHLAYLMQLINENQQLLETEGSIVEGSTGSLVTNPRVNIIHKSIAECGSIMHKLGMGPVSRMRLALNNKELQKDGDNKAPKVELD